MVRNVVFDMGKLLLDFNVERYLLRVEREEDVVAATAEYGATIHAAVQKDNLLACQFHPEKSGEVGLKLLRNFKAMAEGGN